MPKRLIISFSVIGIVAAAVIGATVAYFNDTETSSANILVAGTMNLQVDHRYSSYNGEECTTECIENLGGNIIQNGSFEFPEVTNDAKWDIFPSGTSGLDWTVEWNGGSATHDGRTRPETAQMEYHRGVLGSAEDGHQYTELDSDWYGPDDPLNNEPSLVRIYQYVPTTPGAKYRLHYFYAARPNTSTGQNILDVEIDDVNVASHNAAAGGGAIDWHEYTYEFYADYASTKVEFIGGGTNDSLGVFLDYVTLNPYICDYQIVGGSCTLWDEKELGEGDVFWNFDDVKPGDHGITVISLHAYDNDAYACLINHDIVDAEDTVVDPEIEAGDDIASVVGELSQFIKLFVWEDSNENNAYDDEEPIISGPDAPFDEAIGKISLTATSTEYIGIAWCAGTQSVEDSTINCDGSTMGDIAQSDVMTASITAYAEQQRNNEEFDCASVTLPVQP